MCPETGGKSLEEIDLVFLDKEDAIEQTTSPASESEGQPDEYPEKGVSASEYTEKV